MVMDEWNPIVIQSHCGDKTAKDRLIWTTAFTLQVRWHVESGLLAVGRDAHTFLIIDYGVSLIYRW